MKEVYNSAQLFDEVIKLAKQDSSILNPVYRDISEKLGADVAKAIYSMFKGQQITFPVRFFNPEVVRDMVKVEYNGQNTRRLAAKYGYSEKTIRRMVNAEERQEESK